MGSGASSAEVRSQIEEASQEGLKNALESLSPEERARLTTALEGADGAKVPAFEKPPMEVPGISKEEPAPKLAPVAVAPPAGGRPRSAEMKKKATPPEIDCSEKTVVKAGDSTLEAKPETPNAEMHTGMPKERPTTAGSTQKEPREAKAASNGDAGKKTDVKAHEAEDAKAAKEKVAKEKAEADRVKAELAKREGSPGTPSAEMHICLPKDKPVNTTEMKDAPSSKAADISDASKVDDKKEATPMAECAEVVAEK